MTLQVIGFAPTGWMYEMSRQQFVVKRQGPLAIHLVPYSEHSSYTELQQYVKFLKPKQLVPTVGVGDDASGKKRAAILKHFRGLVDETASKARCGASFGDVMPFSVPFRALGTRNAALVPLPHVRVLLL